MSGRDGKVIAQYVISRGCRACKSAAARIPVSATIRRIVPDTRCRMNDATKFVSRPVDHNGIFHIAAYI
jgi:hypothetical protein